MALRMKREKPVSELTTKELEKRLSAAGKAIENLPSPDAPAEVRDAALALARAATAQLPALRAEMKSRSRLARHRERETQMARGAIERGRQMLLPETVERFSRLGQMLGLRLDPKKLTEEERRETLRIFAGRHEDLSDADRLRLETLAEKAADRPGIFAQRRAEAAAKRQRNELLEEAHTAMLPRRPRYEEPGAVVLPRVVFAWLQQAKGNEWSLADIGALAVLPSAFEERRSLVGGAVFEERDGETVLAARGPIAKLAFERRINPHISYSVGSTGWVDLGPGLKRLAANGWFDVRELAGGRVEIRLGTRARKLLERGQESR